MRFIAKTEKTKIKHLSAIGMLCGLVIGAFAAPSNAQLSEAELSNNDNEGMYRVEMIVFKRGSYTDNRYANSETWPKNIDLYYPENIRSLFTPEQKSAAIRQYEKNATLYDLSENDIKTRVQSNSIVTLPVNSRALRKEARRVMARREISVLFHEAWNQKLDQNADSIALAITGGEKYGNHFQLEGSVIIRRSRYLHIHTQLWLSAFEVNQGQELQFWPTLPLHPVALGQEFNLRPSITSESNRTSNNQGFDNGRINSWSDIDNSTTNNSVRDKSSTEHLAENGAGMAVDILDGNSQTEAQPSPRFSDDPFIIKNIITMNQRRRMRSDEIHYIDHPRMGIIIKIVPLITTDTALENNEN